MFDQLFKCPIAVARYHASPLLKERLAYLRHLASQGYSRICADHSSDLGRFPAGFLSLCGNTRLVSEGFGRFHSWTTNLFTIIASDGAVVG